MILGDAGFQRYYFSFKDLFLAHIQPSMFYIFQKNPNITNKVPRNTGWNSVPIEIRCQSRLMSKMCAYDRIIKMPKFIFVSLACINLQCGVKAHNINTKRVQYNNYLCTLAFYIFIISVGHVSTMLNWTLESAPYDYTYKSIQDRWLFGTKSSLATWNI
jgi:hypothetical protein